MAVVIRRRCVAGAVMRRIGATGRVAVVARCVTVVARRVAVVIVHARGVVVAGACTPRTIVAMRAIAVVDAGALVGGSVVAAVVPIAVRRGDIAFLVGAVRREVAGAGIGRALVDVVI